MIIFFLWNFYSLSYQVDACSMIVLPNGSWNFSNMTYVSATLTSLYLPISLDAWPLWKRFFPDRGNNILEGRINALGPRLEMWLHWVMMILDKHDRQKWHLAHTKKVRQNICFCLDTNLEILQNNRSGFRNSTLCSAETVYELFAFWNIRNFRIFSLTYCNKRIRLSQ